jgi:hypothetical protein
MNTTRTKVITICSAIAILFTSYYVVMFFLSYTFGHEIVSNNIVRIPVLSGSFVLALGIGKKMKRSLVKKAI